MELNTIKPAAGSKKNRRRVGRGIGSGLGKTAGRGHKGQKARAGLKKARLVPNDAKRAKIILAGKLEKAVKVSGIPASKGAKAAIEKAGGSVADIVVTIPKHAKKPRAEESSAAK